MSGMCGIVRWDEGAVETAWLRAMMDAVPYRGPDGRGEYIQKSVALGYLSRQVTPESQGETQPVVHAATQMVLTAHLRLDNREELPGAGKDPCPTDAELVLNAYLEWGEAMVSRLLGDFALALWDPRNRTVLLARDAMGMRPLYYLATARRLLWATELKQILTVPGVEKKRNETAIASYLSGLDLPLGMSFYEGVSQVEPGHMVTLTSNGKKSARYWKIDPEKHVRYRREGDYVAHFRDLFTTVVECRLRSARPVGISLSGGMDSGSVAATVGWLYEQGKSRYRPKFLAYNWAFDGLPQCDERAASRLITSRYGIRAVDIPADAAWPLKDYPEHGPDRDEPFFGMYQVLIDRTVDAAARDGVGVLFSGDRGDLMVGGSVSDLQGLCNAGHPLALLREARTLQSYSGESLFRIGWQGLARPAIARIVRSLGRKPRPYTRKQYSNAPPHVRPSFLAGALDPAYLPFSQACNSDDRAFCARYQHVFVELHMQGMVWSERTNARLGVDFADPWSDRRVAEFVLAIPQHIVHRLSEPKRIVRKAMAGIMPPEALAAVRKVSPEPLYKLALRERARVTVEALCTDMASARLGYVDGQAYRRQMERLFSGEIERFNLWGTLSLEMWLRRYWQ